MLFFCFQKLLKIYCHKVFSWLVLHIYSSIMHHYSSLSCVIFFVVTNVLFCGDDFVKLMSWLVLFYSFIMSFAIHYLSFSRCYISLHMKYPLSFLYCGIDQHFLCSRINSQFRIVPIVLSSPQPDVVGSSQLSSWQLTKCLLLLCLKSLPILLYVVFTSLLHAH